ncbi:MAG: phosphoribosylaminoimidazolesuccinocarboxamide synthase [Acidimicrobiales bacterium]
MAGASSGKVRDIFRIDDETLLMVTSDRMSAFDVVMAQPIPDKGRVLTAFTAFWLERLGDVAPHHLIGLQPPAGWRLPGAGEDPAAPDLAALAGRTMVVRRAEMLPVECVVRGYLAGSAWAEYARHGTVNGEPMPSGLRRCEQLPQPIFTPSTKATVGHDESISFAFMVEKVGRAWAERARALSLEVYRRGATLAAERGILIADTKLELGVVDGELAICDEVLTPDSSRFWPADGWEPGTVPASFDKQPLRDWLEASGWSKTPPPPPLPPAVVEETRARYVDAYERVTGRRFADWPGVRTGAAEAAFP